jgi:hypothetical protein
MEEIVKPEYVKELFVNADKLTISDIACLEEYAAVDVKTELLTYLADDFGPLVKDYLKSDYTPEFSILYYVDDRGLLDSKTYRAFWTSVFNFNKITKNDFKEAWLDVFGTEIKLNQNKKDE